MIKLTLTNINPSILYPFRDNDTVINGELQTIEKFLEFPVATFVALIQSLSKEDATKLLVDLYAKEYRDNITKETP